MTFTEHKEAIDPEHAVHFVALTRHLLDGLRDRGFEEGRSLLQIAGYPRARDEAELDALTRTLHKSVSMSRSGGVY